MSRYFSGRTFVSVFDSINLKKRVLNYDFVVTANLSSVFKGWKICRWRVFHKNLFATKEGGEKKELVWLRDPCKICHFNVCNVLRMHRDFLGKFFPPCHSRRVSS